MASRRSSSPAHSSAPAASPDPATIDTPASPTVVTHRRTRQEIDPLPFEPYGGDRRRVSKRRRVRVHSDEIFYRDGYFTDVFETPLGVFSVSTRPPRIKDGDLHPTTGFSYVHTRGWRANLGIQHGPEQDHFLGTRLGWELSKPLGIDHLLDLEAGGEYSSGIKGREFGRGYLHVKPRILNRALTVGLRYGDGGLETHLSFSLSRFLKRALGR